MSAPGPIHHVVVTKNNSGAGSVKIYIDGAAVPTADVSAGQIIANTTTDLVFGAGGANPADFDEFALYDQVLTPAEVLTHFQAGS